MKYFPVIAILVAVFSLVAAVARDGAVIRPAGDSKKAGADGVVLRRHGGRSDDVHILGGAFQDMFGSANAKETRRESVAKTIVDLSYVKPKSAMGLAISEGLSGAVAGLVQVITMMWLRTTVNYQYRHGVNMQVAMSELYLQGGIKRFYRGLPYAMIQGPLCRFGSVASNDMGRRIITSKGFRNWGPSLKIFVCSMIGALLSVVWRVLLMPLDKVKTVLQVDGLEGFQKLSKTVMAAKHYTDLGVLFQGTMATIVATWTGHSWFLVHNFLDNKVPRSRSRKGKGKGKGQGDFWGGIGRAGAIGFASSAFSDTISNSIRVVKTVRQTAEATGVGGIPTYQQVVDSIVKEGGWGSLFGRGLRTRILSNGVQSILFTVIWKGLRHGRIARRRARAVENLGLLDHHYDMDAPGGYGDYTSGGGSKFADTANASNVKSEDGDADYGMDADGGDGGDGDGGEGDFGDMGDMGDGGGDFDGFADMEDFSGGDFMSGSF